MQRENNLSSVQRRAMMAILVKMLTSVPIVGISYDLL
jgi:hypothetical protein